MDRIARFRDLHAAPFVIPNAWDAGSARLLARLGFAAIAATSAGYAFSTGRRDSAAALGRADVLANAAAIAAAVPDLPVSADLADGFARSPEGCAEAITLAARAGLAGGSIEDATGDPAAPILAADLAAERIRAGAEAARATGFVLTARAENFLWGRPDLGDTIARLNAFAEAGADVLYAPGLPDLAAIRSVCAAVDRPVNVVMGLRPPFHSVAELTEAGVRRISVGGSFFRAAFGALRRAALEVRDAGTFTYTDAAMPGREIEALMD